jgi:hypothetical protein
MNRPKGALQTSDSKVAVARVAIDKLNSTPTDLKTGL